MRSFLASHKRILSDTIKVGKCVEFEEITQGDEYSFKKQVTPEKPLCMLTDSSIYLNSKESLTVSGKVATINFRTGETKLIKDLGVATDVLVATASGGESEKYAYYYEIASQKPTTVTIDLFSFRYSNAVEEPDIEAKTILVAKNDYQTNLMVAFEMIDEENMKQKSKQLVVINPNGVNISVERSEKAMPLFSRTMELEDPFVAPNITYSVVSLVPTDFPTGNMSIDLKVNIKSTKEDIKFDEAVIELEPYKFYLKDNEEKTGGNDSSKSGAISGGAIAGISISCILIVAIIGVALFIFIVRRRKNDEKSENYNEVTV